VTERLLRPGFKVSTATSAEVAWTMALKTTFAVVLTDYDLPRANGAWLLAQLAAARPGTRRVLTSGGEVPGVDQLLERGIVHRFLKKPSSPRDLLEAMVD
jgi:DNA-binding response OmpR family regulator